LQILSSDLLIEMFDLWGKELKYGKELLLNHYGKSVQDSVRFAGPVGRVKTVVTNHLRKMFWGCIHKGNRTQYCSQDKFG